MLIRKKKKLISLVLLYTILSPVISFAQSRTETDLSGKGWKLWYDKNAQWKQDKLYFPAKDMSKLPVNEPTGGWDKLNSNEAIDVSIPGTVEEYLQKVAGPGGDITGVSWWFRTLTIPEAKKQRRLILRFESVRQRAEIYVNRKLAGYDIVGNTPFETDFTNAAKPGETILLAIRITDPGGNFDWKDGASITWGDAKIPTSHGFGGITGRVKFISCDQVFVDDIYIRNTPAITGVVANFSVRNTLKKEMFRDVTVNISERDHPEMKVFHTELKKVRFVPGESSFPVNINVPNAKIWDPENPNLYNCEITLNDKDEVDKDIQTFGFRWFDMWGVGKNAMFRLNGKRIVLRTSISWGFWPVNGIFPTEELAEKQIHVAKEMGLNMLNFHRCIGQPIVLEKADEYGLLYYEEPGNYRGADGDPFARMLMHEKVMRMVKRDRSHPSMIIFNMINEMGPVNEKLLASHASDIRDAHKLDPSRIITHTSAWVRGNNNDDQARMHMRPGDTTLYTSGWFDFHHAGGPAVWSQSLYKNPGDYYNLTSDTSEIVYWGEEGAISTPPRLELIKSDLDKIQYKGWDGQMYLDWYNTFNDFLSKKGLRPAFPTVDAFTSAMGNISMEHQGRKIETIRMNNVTDGYAINGWESEIIENHSGIVDCFRNPKGDPKIMAWYNQPLYVAVKTRSQVVRLNDTAVIDFYAINETDLKGLLTLKITATDPAGKKIFQRETPVSLKGGDTFGQLLTEGIKLPVIGMGGMFRIEAHLIDPSGVTKANGKETILAVDWESSRLPGKGSVWEYGSMIQNFLKTKKNIPAAPYTDRLNHQDWIVVTRPPEGNNLHSVASAQLRDVNGKQGITVSFYKDPEFGEKITERNDNSINFNVPSGATPDPAVTFTERYNVRWEGQLIPENTGTHYLELQVSGESVLYLNGQPVISIKVNSGGKEKYKLELTRDQPVAIRIDMIQTKNAGHCTLLWSTPENNAPDPQKLLSRIYNEGTNMILIDNADSWMDLIGKNAKLTCTGKFYVGTTWLGGNHFVKQHPLFKDLPVNDGMNWPYQAVVQKGAERYGLEMEGEELIAGAYHCYPMHLGTAVGIIPYGKGKIIFSTLDICGNISSAESPAEVARKLLCNFIEFAGSAVSK